MMFLKKADDLISPYLRHSKYEELKSKTPRLQELQDQINEELNKVDAHPMTISLTDVGKKAEELFNEFAEICKQGLR